MEAGENDDGQDRLPALAATFLAGIAQPADFQPAIIFDMGGKFDKSFNEAAYNGAEKFKKETGIDYREFEITQREPSASRRCARMVAARRDDRRRRGFA